MSNRDTTPPAWMYPNGDRDWRDDYPNDNGCYGHTCLVCEQPFVGHKRRHVCRVCIIEGQRQWEAMTPEQQAAERQALIDQAHRLLSGAIETEKLSGAESGA